MCSITLCLLTFLHSRSIELFNSTLKCNRAPKGAGYTLRDIHSIVNDTSLVANMGQECVGVWGIISENCGSNTVWLDGCDECEWMMDACGTDGQCVHPRNSTGAPPHCQCAPRFVWYTMLICIKIFCRSRVPSSCYVPCTHYDRRSDEWVCKPCTECGDNAKIISSCSTVEDTKCQCPQGKTGPFCAKGLLHSKISDCFVNHCY